MRQAQLDHRHMLRACQVALQARGYAEPNPTVGCLIAVDEHVLSEGWTQPFGGAHAEVHALQRVAPDDALQLANATLYVTLEPCCHHGKTPPCTDAILATAIRRVVVAMPDPFPQVAGEGIRRLRAAGLEVHVGTAMSAAETLLAPYLKRLRQGQPWVIGKWAMTLDGKIATKTGDSRWISSPASREIVHRLRGRVDAILVGVGTAIADDPQLTARPAGPRVAIRIVLDTHARLPTDSKLVASTAETPLLVAVGPEAQQAAIRRLQDHGVEVIPFEGATPAKRLDQLLSELGTRKHTNLLVEGGATVLGALFDSHSMDEVHVFVSPKLLGGPAVNAVAGQGIARMAEAIQLKEMTWQQVDMDIYVSGRLRK